MSPQRILPVALLLLPALFLLLRVDPVQEFMERLQASDDNPGGSTATVVAVADGDTFEVMLVNGRRERVRMLGIDTPETVHPSKPVQCFGKEASDRLHALLDGRDVTLDVNPAEDRDDYGRLLRYVAIDGEDIGARMVAEGFAFSLKQFPHPRLDQYNALERSAREGSLGLWGPTCSYAPLAPAGCAIKGNVSDGKRSYHLPGCSGYAQTQIDPARGERWFCSEQEALAAGWTKASNCP